MRGSALTRLQHTLAFRITHRDDTAQQGGRANARRRMMNSDIAADPNGGSNLTSAGLHRRSHWWIVGIMSVTVTLMIGGVAFVGLPDVMHRRTLKRMERWIRPELGTPAAGEARGIHEVKRALSAAAVNWPLWYRQNAPTEKLVVVADYLDRTKGAAFQSYAGALHVLALLEDVSPSLHDYPWIESLREMQNEGIIPPPPASHPPKATSAR
jgi:hypothetical protein